MKEGQSPKFQSARFACLLALAGMTFSTHAAVLQASDGSSGAVFGGAVSLTDDWAIIGARSGINGLNFEKGAAYLFRDLDRTTAATNEAVKLIASDAGTNNVFSEFFGTSVTLRGDTALVGASDHDIGINPYQGEVYLFRDLNEAVGTITENARLIASDGGSDQFGSAVSLVGNSGLIGAQLDTIGSNLARGSAYLFRSLDTAVGTMTENVKLIASDGTPFDYFGASVSLSDTSGLIGAAYQTVDGIYSRGSAYIFRHLDTATGTVTENAKLIASDGGWEADFGGSVSLSGNNAVIGARLSSAESSLQGSAYLFRNLDIATGTITETANLLATDRTSYGFFGISVALFGTNALVAAFNQSGVPTINRGLVYLFSNLDQAVGSVTETLKITASGGAEYDQFGSSVSLEGDRFVIGAAYATGNAAASGRAYSGTISALTTLDAGTAVGSTDGLSFFSWADWVIGQFNDANEVSLTNGDSATIAAGKSVYIGKTTGSDGNTLIIAGKVSTDFFYVGSRSGNTGNVLQLQSTAIFAAGAIRLAPKNRVLIEKTFSSPNALAAYFGSTKVQIWSGGKWTTVTAANFRSLITISASAGYTTIQPK